MKKYYTTLQLTNNVYIGQIFDASNNQLLFTTKPHTTQRHAVQEMDSFIDGTTVNETVTLKPSVVEPSVVESTPTQAPRKRCCGR
jgi:hypothetical protein